MTGPNGGVTLNSTKRDGAARRGKRRMVAAVHTPPKAELNEDDPEVIAARLYNRFVDARIQMLTTPEPATSAYQASNEALWSAVADALNHQRSTGVALPQEMIFELESELRDWLSGTPSKRLPLLTRRGRSLAPVTRSCQLFAVMYLVASPQITGDRRARKTIKNQFFIVESTLQRWKTVSRLRRPRRLRTSILIGDPRSAPNFSAR